MLKQLLFSLFVLVITGFSLQSQSFGGHPSKVKWKQINSENVRVIFPEGLDNRAARIVGTIEHINTNNTYSVGDKSKKLDLVLQTNQVVSNGFVAIAPYRSEFYGTGLQNFNLLGSIDWLDVLSIHEYRHALQFTNGNRGFTKLLHVLQGQLGWALGINLSVPNWYFEGDATLSETLLSTAGRGRTPSFFIEQKANLLAGKEYSYMTSRNGSYKKMLPNHYPLGYAICNYTRNEHGMDVWKDIIADAGRYRSILYPFSGAMKRHTGKRPKEMYKLAYAQLKSDWENELKQIKLTPTQPITKKNKRTVTEYKFAQILNDGSIVAIKSSFKEISHIVHINNGKEKKLTSIGISPEPYLAENNGRLSLTELQQDPRRANRNYTRVVTYDIKGRSKRYVTSKSKYFSPQVSSDGSKIVAVHADENLQSQLQIISADKGSVIQSIPNPNNDFLSYPKWSKDDNSIIYLAKRESKIALIKHDLNEGTNTMLTNWTAQVIGAIDISQEQVYFSASFSGTDNIYTVSLSGNKEITKLTSVRVGAYQPSISEDGKNLVFGEFTDMGYMLSQVLLNKKNAVDDFEIIEPIEQTRYRIKTNPNEENIISEVEIEDYKVKPYKGIFKGLKLHSWSLGREDDNPKLNLSFANILTNFEANIGTIYNSNEETTNVTGNMKFGRWFTEIGLEGGLLNREVDYYSADTITTETFRETNYGASLSIPLSWVKGNYHYGFLPLVKYTNHKTSEYKNEETPTEDLSFGTISCGATFWSLRRTALQNIQPRLGISLNVQHQISISDVEAERINARGTAFLPGLSKNHGIRIDAGYQKELSTNEFQFSDLFFYSRGYESAPNDETYRIAFNYAMPLLYPDWGFGGLTYFKRIRANLFYDMGSVKFNDVTSELNSYGVELIFDNTFFNFIPASIGLRQSFLLDEDVLNPEIEDKFEVFLSIGF